MENKSEDIIIYRLRQEAMVNVQYSKGDWSKIDYPVEGWVYSPYLQFMGGKVAKVAVRLLNVRSKPTNSLSENAKIEKPSEETSEDHMISFLDQLEKKLPKLHFTKCEYCKSTHILSLAGRCPFCGAPYGVKE